MQCSCSLCYCNMLLIRFYTWTVIGNWFSCEYYRKIFVYEYLNGFFSSLEFPFIIVKYIIHICSTLYENYIWVNATHICTCSCSQMRTLDFPDGGEANLANRRTQFHWNFPFWRTFFGNFWLWDLYAIPRYNVSLVWILKF